MEDAEPPESTPHAIPAKDTDAMSDFVRHFHVDKDDIETWTHDWQPYAIGGETLSSVSFSVPTGITNAASSTSGYTSSIRMSFASASVGRTYKVEAQATFSNSDKSSVHILITITN